MKKMSAIALVAAGAMSVGSVAWAGPVRANHGPNIGDRVMEVRNALSEGQRAALLDAAANWNFQADYDKLMTQVDRDVNRIMGPEIGAKYMDIVDGNDLAYGGRYLKVLCVTTSGLGFLLSSVGAIGCTNETAVTSMVEAYAAFIFANNCMLTGADNCESAMNAAGASAAGWLSMFDSCDVADTAYYSMAATYATCGGTWE